MTPRPQVDMLLGDDTTMNTEQYNNDGVQAVIGYGWPYRTRRRAISTINVDVIPKLLTTLCTMKLNKTNKEHHNV